MTELSKKEQFLQMLQGYEHTASIGESPVATHIASVFDRAQAALGVLDFPTTRVEDWKYTRVGKIVNHHWKIGAGTVNVDPLRYHIPRLDCHTLVFINGFYRKDLSDTSTDDLVAIPMSQAIKDFTPEFQKLFGSLAQEEASIFTALNSAYATNGAFVMIKEGKKAPKPVHLVYLNEGNDMMSQPRNVIYAQKSAEMNVIQSYFSADGVKSFINAVTEIHVENNAKLTIDKIQHGADQGFVNAHEKVVQHRDAHFRLNTISLKGGWIRNTTEVRVDGENGLTDLFGTYMPKGKSHVDNHTTIDHAVANCESNELYKGIIHDASTGVFNGKVFVREDAQKTNAYQQNANIVMTENGSMNSKPELEIYADDVKCSHGSTTGQFDEDALFYLMTRGISKESAKKLLIAAFVSDVIDKVGSDELRDHLHLMIEA